MTTPMPKQRSMLQKASLPRNHNTFEDPDAAIHQVPVMRTLMGDKPGAVPSEAYQYELVYTEFRNDAAFWDHWKVKDCARCGTEESISQKNSYIRVVMDLPKEVKLYPTAYTPGFPTVPRDAGVVTGAEPGIGRIIPGLPEGYSVALDVYILEDAKILLQHQRAFRGRVDPAYRWLDKIVNPGLPPEELESGELAIADVNPADSSVVHPAKHWTWHSGHGGDSAELALPNNGKGPNPKALGSLREVIQPAAGEELPLSCFTACPRGLARDESLSEDAKGKQTLRKEIHMENALINAFGDHVGLPQREGGRFWGKSDDAGYASRQEAYKDESAKLDRDLEALLDRTVTKVVPDEEEQDQA